MPDSKVSDQTLTVTPGKPVVLPQGETGANAEFTRDGQDLCLSSNGHTTRIEGYFTHDPSPDVVTADGAARFTPKLVASFLPPEHVGEYAETSSGTASDATGAVGRITKVDGEATIVRTDGTKVKAEVGSMLHMGDVVTTGKQGAVNIIFADNTSFSISRSAKLAIDEFTYNPEDHQGTSYFSVLQGVFVYQSGDIGKEDPSKVNINTPVGSIGIRGTLVAGEINPAGEESKITIVDGAVIITNGGGELVLNDSFETATLTGFDSVAINSGQLDSATFTTTYGAVAPVTTSFFSAVANGTYSTTPTSNTTTTTVPTDGTTQQTTQPAPGDSLTTQPQTDGTTTVAPPPSDTVAPSTESTLPPPPSDTQLSPDATVLPPPPPPPQDTLLQPQPLPGTQTTIITTDGSLPPPPTGSTFVDTSGSTFTTTTGTTFTGTTTTTTTSTSTGGTSGGSTGGTTTTTQTTTTGGTAPPPPAAQWVFAPVYLNGTPTNTTDDGLPIFGVGLNASALNPVMIGQIQLSNFAAPPVITITGANYNAVTGEFLGNTLQYTSSTIGSTGASIMTNQPIMEFDSAGRLMLVDPTGLLGNLNGPGYFNFTVNVTDGAGNVFLNQTVFVNVKQVVPGGAYSIQVGDHSLANRDINDPGQLPVTVDNLLDTAGNDLLIAGEGNAAAPLFGNVLRSSLGGNDVLVGGSGRDLLIHDATGGSVKMYGMGGDDTMKVAWSNIATGTATVLDAGAGNDTLVLGPFSGAGGLTFDFSAAPNTVFNVEKIQIEQGSAANTVALDVRDVFEMTDGNHTLHIGQTGTGFLSRVDIVNSSAQPDFAVSSTNGTEVTYTGFYNGATVTLIIQQGPNPGGGDGIQVSLT